jgi:hypothetical protein
MRILTTTSLKKISRLRLIAILVCFLFVPLAGCGWDPWGQLAGNDVPAEHFHEYLIRDLRSYFKLEAGSTKAVGYELLRDHVEQCGLGWPHYFLWVYVYEGNQVITEGFAEVNAMNTTEFGMEKFISKEQIKKTPKVPPEYLSASLWSDIVARANKP